MENPQNDDKVKKTKNKFEAIYVDGAKQYNVRKDYKEKHKKALEI